MPRLLESRGLADLTRQRQNEQMLMKVLTLACVSPDC